MKHLFTLIIFIGLTHHSTADTHIVNAGGFYFNPASITISTGDTVVWINDGGLHDVNGVVNSQTGQWYNNPESFGSSSTSTPGATIYTHVFTIPGTYDYDCSVGNHAALGMTGTIFVEQNPIIESINPQGGILNEAINITINGVNTNFVDETDLNAQFFLANGNDTVFQNTNGNITFNDTIFGTVFYADSITINGSFIIPYNLNIPFLNLFVYDYSLNDFLQYEDVFLIDDICVDTIYTSHCCPEEFTFCGQQDFDWNGQLISESGTYYDTLYTGNCVNIISYDFTFVNSQYDSVYTCYDSYNWNGQTYYESGIYEEVVLDAWCGSYTNYLYLNILNPDSCSKEIDTLFYEDFQNGLNGNSELESNNWAISGPDANIWQHDFDGSNGDYSSNILLDSDSKNNGWMIFDCDYSNSPFNPSTLQSRSGELISPIIDLSNNDNVKLTFDHSYRWCCDYSHKIELEISNDGGNSWQSYWLNMTSSVNEPLYTKTESFDLSSIIGGQDSVQIKFDWSNNQATASHYFWMIDDVRINSIPFYHLSTKNEKLLIESEFWSSTNYTSMPINQFQNSVTFLNFDLFNDGINNQTNLELNVNLNNQLISISLDDIDGQSTNNLSYQLQIDSLNLGSNSISLNVHNNINSSNIETLNFFVSEDEFSRDKFNESGVDGSIIFGDNLQKIGNSFEFSNQDTIYGLRAYFHEQTSNEGNVFAIIYLLDTTNLSLNYLSESSVTNIANKSNQWVNFKLIDPVDVNEGDIIVGMIGTNINYQDTIRIATSGLNQNYLESIATEQLFETQNLNVASRIPLIRLSMNQNFESTVSISPSTAFTNNVINVNITGVPNNSPLRLINDSNIILLNSFNENNLELYNFYTGSNTGFWDVEYYDYETNIWTTLIINGFEIQQGPSISNITPSQISTNSGYTEFEITFSNIGYTFQNEITDWYQFLVNNTNGQQLEFYPISIINDSTILVFSENYVDTYTILNNWFVAFGVDSNIVSFSGNLNSNIEINLPSACNIANDFISFNEIFSENGDTIRVCENSTVSINTHPYSISNFYWDNNSYSNILSVQSEQSRVLFYSNDDTTCEINSYEFEIIQLDDVAITSITPNSCFGIDDGFIEIFSPYEFIEMGTTCCDEMGNEYIEGYSDYIFSYYTDQISFYEYLDNQNGYTNLTVNNNSNVSNIYVVNNFTQSSCILDIDFDTELNNPQFYTLPFEESFDSGMPCDWENDSQWSFGQVSDILGPYWNIPDHNHFAVSNDDACDCDMMQDRLITPPLIVGNLEGDLSVSFSTFFTGDYGSIANIEISNDMGDSWQNIDLISPSSDWQDISINISDYVSSDTIQLGFRHSDSHSWGSGFAIDDVLVDFQCLDSDDDGICDDDEVLGCTNTLANNFNELATEDDGTCQIDIFGCTYTSAINYNSEATIDDGSCYFSLQGCTDPSATNYDSSATQDDGSCNYLVLDNPCDAAPIGLFVDNIIHNRVVFNWDAPTSAPSYYMIRYRPVGASQWTVMRAGPETANPFNGTSRTRYFMEPGTTYQWNIRARNIDENGVTICQSPWSASHEFTTLDACPNLVNHFVNTEANWVNFNASNPESIIDIYDSKGKLREVGSNSYRYVTGSNDGIDFRKGNFTPSTDYEWHTKAWCVGNVDDQGNPDPQYHSGWGEFYQFSTQDPCDKMPTNLYTTTNNNQNLITMNWSTPESGAPHHYFLELVNETTGQVFQWNNIAGSATSKTKYNQVPGHEFSWRIRGACGSIGTSWATIFTQPVYYTLGAERVKSEMFSDLNVYPNPSRGEFKISFNLESRQDVYLSITNYLGEVILTEELKEQEGQYNKTIDLSKKANGIYMLNITTNNQNINQKIIIQ